MPSKHFSSARKIAVFVTAMLTLAAVQPAQAQAPQPGGVPIATATPDTVQPAKAVPVASTASVQDTYDLAHFRPTDSATNWAAHPLTFKIGKSAGYVAPTTPTYAADGAMQIDIKLVFYIPPGYGGGCCSNQMTRVNNLIAWLENGSRWLGTGSRSIDYNIVGGYTVMFTESPHIGGNPAANGDIGAVMNDLSPTTCTFIANNPRPVQVWMMGTSRGHMPEFAVDGPRFENGFHLTHNQPACSKTYAFFGYAYVGETYDGANNWGPIPNPNMMEDHIHYVEWMLWNSARLGYPNIGCNAMNPVGNLPGRNAATDFYEPSSDIISTAMASIYSLYECATVGLPMGPRNNFMARPTYYNGSAVSVGDTHHPDNIFPGPGDHSYDWTNGWGVWSGADTWWTQNYGLYTAVGCGNWGCTQEGAFQRYLQHMPCRNTTAYDRSGVNFGQVMGPNIYGWCGLQGFLLN